MLSCFMKKCSLVREFFQKVPPDPLPPPILYEYKIANLPELLISSLIVSVTAIRKYYNFEGNFLNSQDFSTEQVANLLIVVLISVES